MTFTEPRSRGTRRRVTTVCLAASLALGLVAARYVDIGNTGGLEGQPYEFAATLDRRPVMKFICHARTVARRIG